MGRVIPRRIEPSVRPADLEPRQVARELRRLVDGGARLRPAGSAREAPLSLLSGGYSPRFKLELFETTYYLTNVRQNPDLRFFIAYVVPAGRREVFPRLFYKDISLVWRAASHYVHTDGDFWIGKGDVQRTLEGGDEVVESMEATTDLPFEIQSAVESLSRRAKRVRSDGAAVDLVVRRAPEDRVAPYRDFTEPRRLARAEAGNLVHGGRPVVRFRRRNDPTSLVFAAGFEPDFGRAPLEIAHSSSKLYGGRVRRFRILSRNRQIQYLFFAGPRHVWIAPPQALTTEISSFGVRTIDVAADEDLFIPGYEYHYVDDEVDPAVLYSQIPEGHAGEVSELDDSRVDASPWLDRLPVVQEFRRKLLRRR